MVPNFICCFSIDLGTTRTSNQRIGTHYVVLSDYDVTCWAVLTDHPGIAISGWGLLSRMRVTKPLPSFRYFPLFFIIIKTLVTQRMTDICQVLIWYNKSNHKLNDGICPPPPPPRKKQTKKQKNKNKKQNKQNKTTTKNKQTRSGWQRLVLGRTRHQAVTLGRDKMADIFLTTFLNGFSWMETYEFWSKFHLSLFLTFQLTQYSSIGSDNGLAPIRRQAIIWTNDG